MNAVILDAATLVPDFNDIHIQNKHWDISRESLEASVTELTIHSRTNQEQIIKRCSDAEIIITNKVILSREELSQLKKLKLICITATGTNNVDLEAAKELGIRVTNVAGYSTDSVAQLTFTLILSLQHQMMQLGRLMKEEGWDNQQQFIWLPHAFTELSGKTLGIIGQGAIGQRVAEIARSFSMNVLFAQLPHRPEEETKTPLLNMLPVCDVISLHCPHTIETERLVNDTFLSNMKSSALLINTARGALIDEEALLEALTHDKIGGAGLDVLSIEPPPKNHCLANAALDNLLITPHLAWASRESRQRLLNSVADNIISYTNGGDLNVVA